MRIAVTATAAAALLGCGADTQRTATASVCELSAARLRLRTSEFQRELPKLEPVIDDLYGDWKGSQSERMVHLRLAFAIGKAGAAAVSVGRHCLAERLPAQCDVSTPLTRGQLASTITKLGLLADGLDGTGPCTGPRTRTKREFCKAIGLALDTLPIQLQQVQESLATSETNDVVGSSAWQTIERWRALIDQGRAVMPVCLGDGTKSCLEATDGAFEASPEQLVDMLAQLEAAFEEGTPCSPR